MVKLHKTQQQQDISFFNHPFKKETEIRTKKGTCRYRPTDLKRIINLIQVETGDLLLANQRNELVAFQSRGKPTVAWKSNIHSDPVNTKKKKSRNLSSTSTATGQRDHPPKKSQETRK